MTAGNGPEPRGLRRTPCRSMGEPSSVPRRVHAAPAADSASPVTVNSGPAGPGVGIGAGGSGCGWGAVGDGVGARGDGERSHAPARISEPSNAVRHARTILHWTMRRQARPEASLRPLSDPHILRLIGGRKYGETM